MKKAFLSANAMSLFFWTSLWAQSGQVLLERKLLQKTFSPDQKEWQYDTSLMPKDPMRMNGQLVSMIDWSEDPDRATDYERWLSKNKLKDENPEWLLRLRHGRQMEVMGKLLSCAGTCEVVRGITSVKGEHFSEILEGDELKLHDHSIAWVYLIDGGLLKISPKTTISFQEINFNTNEVATYIKLLEGHAYYLPKKRENEEFDPGPQTDAMSIPLMIEEANEEYFEREIFKVQNAFGQYYEYLNFRDHGKEHIFRKLNELRAENNKSPQIKNTLYFYTSNMSLLSNDVSFDVHYEIGGTTKFIRRSEGSLELILRGYSKLNPIEITDAGWFEVEENGRGHEAISEDNVSWDIIHLLNKRIVSIKLAQEIWFKKYTIPILNNLNSAKKLAEENGYFLWGDKFAKRVEFLDEYHRRLETTHLQSLNNLIKKMEKRGEYLTKTTLDEYYKKPLETYMWSLKKKYDLDKMQVREMNNLQYYVWILRNVRSKKD